VSAQAETPGATTSKISFFSTLSKRVSCRDLRLEFDSPTVTTHSMLGRPI